MTISKMIEQLQKARIEFGDVEVKVFDGSKRYDTWTGDFVLQKKAPFNKDLGYYDVSKPIESLCICAYGNERLGRQNIAL